MMIGKCLFWVSILLVAFSATTDGGRNHRKKLQFSGRLNPQDMMLADDPLFTVQAIGPIEPFGTKVGTCECKCCKPPPGMKQF